ncbi:MAG: diguanylate cyclase [Tatlockia sp.]
MRRNKLIKPTFQFALIKSIIESSPEGILVVDEQGIIQFYNTRFLELWHIPLAGKSQFHIGANDAPLLSTVRTRVKDPQAFLNRVHLLYENPELNDFCEIELKDGRTLERHSTALWDDNKHYLGRVWFFRDISSHKQIALDLGELTRRDPLTNVANRRYFFERGLDEFERAKRYAHPLCIASLDIDYFKKINDRYGHAAGDEVLVSLCALCQKMLRKTELFARIGGEEFAILMPSTELKGAFQLAERIRANVAEHTVSYEEKPIRCTISIGVAQLREADSSIDDCLKRADLAMYLAKGKGRNRVECEQAPLMLV